MDSFSKEPAISSGGNLSNYQNLFICPMARIKSAINKTCNQPYPYEEKRWGTPTLELDSSRHFHGVAQRKNESSVDYYKRLDIYNHPVLPMFGFNNKDDFAKVIDCECWSFKEIGRDDYICLKCYQRFHKECVESPLEIKHPYHPKHSLKLVVYEYNFLNCVHCGYNAMGLAYHCALCMLNMHPICVKQPVSFVLEQTKRHDHPLTLFTRRGSLLDCNVCGLTSEAHPTYACLKCNFVSHLICANSPGVIKISRHNHRISFVLSFPPRKWSCGVCIKNIDCEYGGYICKKCDDYAVHSRCALLKKYVWDKKDLEGVPEEDDVEENVEPFKVISEGIILHFSHEHPLKVETCKFYDERKICQACIIPIYEGDFYSCMECDFILHDTCTNYPRWKQHALHFHPLKLTVLNGFNDKGYLTCEACRVNCCGFIYQCDECLHSFKLDIRCANISEPFHYQGHEHPLFLLNQEDYGLCQACKIRWTGDMLNCIECHFIICFRCVTVPYMVRYKHDKHFLTLGFGDDETSKSYWCEICEKESSPFENEERLYMCNHCCTTLHVDCLLGYRHQRYMKPSITMKLKDGLKVQIFPNYTFSRPICDYCKRRCGDKIFFRTHEKIFCFCREITTIYNVRWRYNSS